MKYKCSFFPFVHSFVACFPVLLLSAVIGTVVLLLPHLQRYYVKNCDQKVCLQRLIEGPPVMNDPLLTRYIQDNYFITPGGGQLNLSRNTGAEDDSSFNQTKDFINNHFNNKRDGRFVVLGAGDGEFLDFTLDLEVEQGWTGLLIEPNPILFEELKKKGRKAEISNACVSPFSYPVNIKMMCPKIDSNLSYKERLLRLRESKLKPLWEKEINETEEFSVQCFPLTNILYSARTIGESFDLLIMDMAGTDLDIFDGVALKSLPHFDMAIVVAHNSDIAPDVTRLFLARKMMLTKTIGKDTTDFRHIITKYKLQRKIN